MEELFLDLQNLSYHLLSKPLLKYERFLLQDVLNTKSKIVGIYGSRGVGKTTLLLQIAHQLPFSNEEILYISCDYPLLSDVSLFEVVEYFVKYGGKCILIDEIHEAKNFQKELKLIYDIFDIKVYFSGSSAIKITDSSFARRYAIKKLPFLSFKEFIELEKKIQLPTFAFEDILQNHQTIADTILQKLDTKILPLFKHYLQYGAYPYYFEDKENFISKLNDSINTVFYHDIALNFNVSASKIIAMKKLLINICGSDPLELSLEALSKKVGISKATFYTYIEYLHKAELLTHILYEGKRFKNMQKPDKLYLAHPTLFEIFCKEKKIGTLRESFFVSQLAFNHTLHYVHQGDFLVDETYVFEIGGAKKGFQQIKDIKNSYVVADDIEIGFKNKIPLWLFGFLY